MVEESGSRIRVPQASREGLQISRVASFWSLTLLITFLLAAASAPSPLYPLYQAKFQFSAITLTSIYALYAVGALTALLAAGRLSDHIGRRRVVAVALAIQIAGMVTFIMAQSVEMLYLARVLQGIGTGVASSAISAWLLDLLPENQRLGSLVGGIAPMAGLGIGAFGSGLLVQFSPDPMHFIYWFLLVIFLVAFIVALLIPDTMQQKPGWPQSLLPRVGVPPSARSMFAALLPSLVAIWALGGLYLSLGASLSISLLHISGPVAGGSVILALLGSAAVASIITRGRSARGCHPSLLRIGCGSWHHSHLRRDGVSRGILHWCRHRGSWLRSWILWHLSRSCDARTAGRTQRTDRRDLYCTLSFIQRSDHPCWSCRHPPWSASHDVRLRFGGDGSGCRDHRCGFPPTSQRRISNVEIDRYFRIWHRHSEPRFSLRTARKWAICAPHVGRQTEIHFQTWACPGRGVYIAFKARPKDPASQSGRSARKRAA